MIAGTLSKAHYIMIGGFLGAGKTTALAKFGQFAQDRGLRVGLISNDQSTGLVDTTMLRSKGFDVEEIAGGCFCCRFNSLVDAANRLTEKTRPDVFLAEPVGSCTDLVATVSYPLRRIYGDQFTVAPLSVLVDPNRCARVLGLAHGRSFSSKVAYVYRKQLEEADLIVINKCDIVDDALREKLTAHLEAEFPRATVIACSAREGDGLADWFASVLDAESADQATMNIDYKHYAEGEALLGWLNSTVRVSCDTDFDANAMLADLAEQLRTHIAAGGHEIAHLKMTLDAGDTEGSLAAVSLVGSDDTVDQRETLLDRIGGGELIINIRAEADPEVLNTATTAVLSRETEAKHGISFTVEHLEHFRPGKPTPTHRIEVSQ
jgi:G3E family GTPase